MAKIYTKVNELSFTVEETKTLKDTIDVKAQLDLLTQQCGRIKSIVAQARQNKDLIAKTVEWYNTWVDILNEAKANCHLAYKELDKIVLPENWAVENIDLSKLPKIDVTRDDEMDQEKETLTF